MYNYKIVVEYDGTNFVGWQQQENGKSIHKSITRCSYLNFQEKK